MVGEVTHIQVGVWRVGAVNAGEGEVRGALAARWDESRRVIFFVGGLGRGGWEGARGLGEEESMFCCGRGTEWEGFWSLGVC